MIQGNRLDLHNILQNALVELGGGKRKDVYFQPPESIQISYPAIIYELKGSTEIRANNKVYTLASRYEVSFITNDPDNDFVKKFSSFLPLCSLSREYISGNLNHYVYTVIY